MNKVFFTELSGRTKWLRDIVSSYLYVLLQLILWCHQFGDSQCLFCFLSQHIDESLHHFRKRLHDCPDLNPTSVVLDTIFFPKVGNCDVNLFKTGDAIPDEFFHYFLGLYPGNYGKTWEGAKKVYAPFNLDNMHWVAVEIVLDDKMILVYDSQRNFIKNEDLLSKFAKTCEVLAVMLSKTGLFPKMDDTPFEMDRVDDLPQNEDG